MYTNKIFIHQNWSFSFSHIHTSVEHININAKVMANKDIYLHQIIPAS